MIGWGPSYGLQISHCIFTWQKGAKELFVFLLKRANPIYEDSIFMTQSPRKALHPKIITLDIRISIFSWVLGIWGWHKIADSKKYHSSAMNNIRKWSKWTEPKEAEIYKVRKPNPGKLESIKVNSKEVTILGNNLMRCYYIIGSSIPREDTCAT